MLKPIPTIPQTPFHCQKEIGGGLSDIGRYRKIPREWPERTRLCWCSYHGNSFVVGLSCHPPKAGENWR